MSPRKTCSIPTPQVHANVYLETGSMQKNEAVMRFYLIMVSFSCRDWSPYKKRNIKTQRHMQRQEGHVMMEAGTRVMDLQAEDHQ